MILASYLAVLLSFVVRLFVPDYVQAIGPALQFFLAGAVVIFGFFLPFLWWRSIIGYLVGAIFGILGVATSAGALIRVAAGELPGDSYIILVPALIFSLSLIGGIVLAWREG